MRPETDWIQLLHGRIAVEAAHRHLKIPTAGALSLFTGITRQFTAGKQTLRLEYECYEAMAMDELRRLADSARSRWPILRLCMLHRLGVVPVSEESVVVGVAAAHRADAFAACRYLIDTLKQQVPIWKREHFADGATEWVPGRLPQPETRSDAPEGVDSADGPRGH